MGIGTSAPAQLLDIVNSGSTIMGVRLQNQFSAGYLSMGAVVGVNSYIGLQAGVATTSALTTPTLCVTNANNVGIGTANPGASLHIYDPTSSSSSAPLMLFAPNLSAGGIQYMYFGTANSANNSAQIGWANVGAGSASNYAFLQIYGKSNIMTWQASTGNVGIGITNPTSVLTVNNTGAYQTHHLIIRGQEFYAAGNSSTGIAINMGVNRAANKQLWFMDPDLAINTTNAAVVHTLGATTAYIGAISTDGSTNVPLSIGGSSITINAGGDISTYTSGSGAGTGVFTNYTRYFRQYGAVNADSHAYFQNTSAGSAAYFNLIVGSDAGNANHFINSSTRTGDGGIKAYTIRNDTGGGVRFLSNHGGFISYGVDGAGATYTNAVVNYTSTTNSGGGGWNGQGYTLFCNTTQPSNGQATLGLGSNNYDVNYISSLSPGVRWMNLEIAAATTNVYFNGVLAAYTVSGSWVNVSDMREKEDINDLKTNRSLERIMKCKPKYYKRKYYEKNKDGNDATPIDQSVKNTVCIGLLAQDVLQHNPHCISEWKNDNIEATDDDNTMRYGINYVDFTVHLIGSVQELNCKINQLTTTTETQAAQITAQATQIQDLSSQLTSVLVRLNAAGIA